MSKLGCSNWHSYPEGLFKHRCDFYTIYSCVLDPVILGRAVKRLELLSRIPVGIGLQGQNCQPPSLLESTVCFPRELLYDL